jgi:superfamily II DNA or RNA helicase
VDYSTFVLDKAIKHQPSGIDASIDQLNSNLFDFQKDLVQLALKAGRFCLWANTGLGKTICQLSWADGLIKHGNVDRILILAPLGVAKQTANDEASKFGFNVNYCLDNSTVKDGITITNYERLGDFDCSQFDAVILDEASILKDETSTRRNQIIEAFKNTPYKLACSATPAPNDYMELGSQCEFLGVMTRAEMLSMFFTHDGGETAKWRLKNHAQDAFWKFVSSWAILVQYPSDLGYDDTGYKLPEINYHSHMVNTHVEPPDGQLLWTDVHGLNEQRHIRKISCNDRCKIASELVKGNNEQWLIWCETIQEGELLKKLIPDAVEVQGKHKADFKEAAMSDFAQGKIRVLITKTKIAGMGLNFQKCHNVIYIGLTHSFEMYYQSVRRVYRFGQLNQVHVHIIQHHLEGEIERNLKRKEKEAERMTKAMLKYMGTHVSKVGRQSTDYDPTVKMILPEWLKSGDD